MYDPVRELYDTLAPLESSNNHEATHPVISGSRTITNNGTRAFGKVGLTKALAQDIIQKHNPKYAYLSGKSWEDIQNELADEEKYYDFIKPALEKVYSKNENNIPLAATAWYGGTEMDADQTRAAIKKNPALLARYSKLSQKTPPRAEKLSLISQAYASDLPVNPEKARSVQEYLMGKNPSLTQKDIEDHFLRKYGEKPELSAQETENIPLDKLENLKAIRTRESEGDQGLSKAWEEYLKSKNP